ncbi:hypothetical protein [Flavobacterium sp. J27]|uniref:hypothetical protein n=1 Tax=Flavobacterium sp. J27 TaxID=2060419 RepID=UPI00102F31F1|nr:hypothetical protein [Flavobacterium sp. J27]
MSYQIQQMISTLSNKVLRLQKVNSDRDYSGGGWYEDISHAMFLYSDFSFNYVIETFRSVTGGGLSMPYQNREEYRGHWKITYENFTTYITFTFEDYSQQKYETQNLGTGLQKMGEHTWNRYLIS